MEVVTRGYKAIENRLRKDVTKGKLSADAGKGMLVRIPGTEQYEDLANVDVLFAAIFENMDVKKEFYVKIDKICKPECVFASNTSGLSITEMASVTKRSDKFVGTHFFNPVPVMKLLEVIRGYDASEDTFQLALALGKKIGKETIAVKEAPLFAVNRIPAPMMNEAMFVLYEGIATAEDIDKGMMLGSNHPIGPLALADLIGLDTLC
jgi:3-hydroxybutyryl-CoA dehydrogenase